MNGVEVKDDIKTDSYQILKAHNYQMKGITNVIHIHFCGMILISIFFITIIPNDKIVHIYLMMWSLES